MVPCTVVAVFKEAELTMKRMSMLAVGPLVLALIVLQAPVPTAAQLVPPSDECQGARTYLPIVNAGGSYLALAQFGESSDALCYRIANPLTGQEIGGGIAGTLPYAAAGLPPGQLWVDAFPWVAGNQDDGTSEGVGAAVAAEPIRPTGYTLVDVGLGGGVCAALACPAPVDAELAGYALPYAYTAGVPTANRWYYLCLYVDNAPIQCAPSGVYGFSASPPSPEVQLAPPGCVGVSCLPVGYVGVGPGTTGLYVPPYGVTDWFQPNPHCVYWNPASNPCP